MSKSLLTDILASKNTKCTKKLLSNIFKDGKNSLVDNFIGLDFSSLILKYNENDIKKFVTEYFGGGNKEGLNLKPCAKKLEEKNKLLEFVSAIKKQAGSLGTKKSGFFARAISSNININSDINKNKIKTELENFFNGVEDFKRRLTSSRLSELLKMFMIIVLWFYVKNEENNQEKINEGINIISEEKILRGPQEGMEKKSDMKYELEERKKQTKSVFEQLKDEKNNEIKLENNKGFKIKMDPNTIKKFYANEKLSNTTKKAVENLPGAKREESLDDTDLRGVNWEFPKDFPFNEKCVLSREEFFGNDDRIPGEQTLKRTEELLEKYKLKLYQINQAASQFNALESTTEEHSPLFNQSNDGTQGPTVCSQSLTAWLKREAMYEDGTLPSAVCEILSKLCEKNVICLDQKTHSYLPTPNYKNKDYFDSLDKKYTATTDQEKYNNKAAFYKNGYLKPCVLNEDGLREFGLILAKYKTGYLSQKAVSDADQSPFTLAFGSGFSYQNCPIDKSAISYAINYMNVYPQYENILKNGKRIAKELGNEYLVIVHVTAIGQGAFANPPGIHHIAFFSAAKKLELTNENSGKLNMRIIYHWPVTNTWKKKGYDKKTSSGVKETINKGFLELGIKNDDFPTDYDYKDE